MELEVLFSGMCLFAKPDDGQAGWEVRVIDAVNPRNVKKSKDGKNVLHHHEAEIWVEIGDPGGGRLPDDEKSKHTELSGSKKVKVKTYRLGRTADGQDLGRETLAFAILDADGKPVGQEPFTDPGFEEAVASLSAIDRSVRRATLLDPDPSRLAGFVRVNEGRLGSRTMGRVKKWKGSELGAEPEEISTSAAWRLSGDGTTVRIRSDRRDQDILIKPEDATVRVWVVSYPRQAQLGQHDHDESTAGHFKWYYDLYDFDGRGPAEELAYPVPKRPELEVANPPSTFCPETRV